MSAHSFRRFYATRALKTVLKNGRPMTTKEVAQILGHANVSTTMVYEVVDTDVTAEQVEDL